MHLLHIPVWLLLFFHSQLDPGFFETAPYQSKSKDTQGLKQCQAHNLKMFQLCSTACVEEGHLESPANILVNNF